MCRPARLTSVLRGRHVVPSLQRCLPNAGRIVIECGLELLGEPPRKASLGLFQEAAQAHAGGAADDGEGVEQEPGDRDCVWHLPHAPEGHSSCSTHIARWVPNVARDQIRKVHRAHGAQGLCRVVPHRHALVPQKVRHLLRMPRSALADVAQCLHGSGQQVAAPILHDASQLRYVVRRLRPSRAHGVHRVHLQVRIRICQGLGNYGEGGVDPFLGHPLAVTLTRIGPADNVAQHEQGGCADMGRVPALLDASGYVAAVFGPRLSHVRQGLHARYLEVRVRRPDKLLGQLNNVPLSLGAQLSECDHRGTAGLRQQLASKLLCRAGAAVHVHLQRRGSLQHLPLLVVVEELLDGLGKLPGKLLSEAPQRGGSRCAEGWVVVAEKLGNAADAVLVHVGGQGAQCLHSGLSCRMVAVLKEGNDFRHVLLCRLTCSHQRGESIRSHQRLVQAGGDVGRMVARRPLPQPAEAVQRRPANLQLLAVQQLCDLIHIRLGADGAQAVEDQHLRLALTSQLLDQGLSDVRYVALVRADGAEGGNRHAASGEVPVTEQCEDLVHERGAGLTHVCEHIAGHNSNFSLWVIQ
mmetsp:Transcript_10923/g.34154  ORF Transcript_10923/g.34154 Transcript_10923/m.34154 type:complete len:579 (-) Transcript_10923:251-1987(-)